MPRTDTPAGTPNPVEITTRLPRVHAAQIAYTDPVRNVGSPVDKNGHEIWPELGAQPQAGFEPALLTIRVAPYPDDSDRPPPDGVVSGAARGRACGGRHATR